jgi:hypothetical protein
VESLWVLVPAGQRASGEWIDDTLRARAEEKGLLDRSPRAGEFPRQRVELIRDADPTAAVNRLYRERGWTDGLPIVPPTLGRVDEMLAESLPERHAALGEVEPLGGVATVEKVAANAVMAGCEPSFFPVVLAAVQALLDPAFNLRGVQTTDENVAPLLVVNGPAAGRLGINAGWAPSAPAGRPTRPSAAPRTWSCTTWAAAGPARSPSRAWDSRVATRSALPSARTRPGRRSTSSSGTAPIRARSRSCARRR